MIVDGVASASAKAPLVIVVVVVPSCPDDVLLFPPLLLLLPLPPVAGDETMVMGVVPVWFTSLPTSFDVVVIVVVGLVVVVNSADKSMLHRSACNMVVTRS